MEVGLVRSITVIEVIDANANILDIFGKMILSVSSLQIYRSEKMTKSKRSRKKAGDHLPTGKVFGMVKTFNGTEGWVVGLDTNQNGGKVQCIFRVADITDAKLDIRLIKVGTLVAYSVIPDNISDPKNERACAIITGIFTDSTKVTPTLSVHCISSEEIMVVVSRGEQPVATSIRLRAIAVSQSSVKFMDTKTKKRHVDGLVSRDGKWFIKISSPHQTLGVEIFCSELNLREQVVLVRESYAEVMSKTLTS